VSPFVWPIDIKLFAVGFWACDDPLDWWSFVVHPLKLDV
jgi:hypothetical protein